MGNRVANLLSRVVTLEERFDSPPSGVAEQRGRGDLIRHVTVTRLRLNSKYSFPLSKLGAIEEQLWPFFKTLGSPGPVDHIQVCEDVFKLLEDLQEAILDFQVCLRPQA